LVDLERIQRRNWTQSKR